MAQTHRHDWSPLLLSLRSADRLSRQILDLLARERAALEQRDYTTFETLMAEKAGLLTALEANTAQRHAWLQEQGLADDAAALARVETDAPELARMWHKLADLWRECQHASRVNEQITQRTHATVTQIIDALSGNAGQGSTYDDKGATRRGQPGRTITSV